MISFIDASASTAADVEAALMECAFNTAVSIPACDEGVLSHLVMVAAVTGLMVSDGIKTKDSYSLVS